MFKIELGSEVKDKFTGYKGIVMGRTEYVTGCNTYGILNQELDKDGNTKDWKWFDEDRLDLIKSKKITMKNKFNGGANSIDSIAPCR